MGISIFPIYTYRVDDSEICAHCRSAAIPSASFAAGLAAGAAMERPLHSHAIMGILMPRAAGRLPPKPISRPAPASMTPGKGSEGRGAPSGPRVIPAGACQKAAGAQRSGMSGE